MKHGARIAAAVGAIALVCLTGSAAAAERSSRTRLSQSGHFGVKLTQIEPGKCRLEVTRDGDPLWNVERCVGTPDDLYFVSDDGEKVWVLVSLPQKPSKKPKKAKFPAWTYAVVAQQVDKGGEVGTQLKFNDLVKSKAGNEDVQQFEKHFKWLEGVAGVSGIPPKVNEQGKVEFQTVDHKKHTLDF